MIRPTRTAVSLIRTLLIGTASVASVAATSSVLVSCANENEPEYWVKKLEDPAWRARSIKRLGQFFEDAVTRADKDISNPEVKALLDKVVEPLTNVYVTQYESLDENTREDLINLISSFRDPRTEPALKKALEEFGQRGRGGRDLKWVSRAVRDLKLKGVGPDLIAAFKKMKPSTKEGAYYRDFNEALIAVADASWQPELVSVLAEDFPVLDPQKKDPAAVNEFKDKLYQTVTAVQLLGETKASSAVDPLLKVVLDPTRAQAGNEALLALTKIGKPAALEAAKLLSGGSPELAQFQKKQIQKANNLKAPPEGDLHQGPAAMILGAIGRPEGIAPLMKALEEAKEDAEKAQLLTALAMMPHTPEVVNTFKEGLKEMPTDASAGQGNALQSLAEPAALMFDTSLVPILVDRAGDLIRAKEIVPASLLTLSAIKLMDPSQVRSVGAVVKRLGKGEGPLAKHLEGVNEAYEKSAKLLEQCKQDAACYMTEAKKSGNQTKNNQIIAIKAIYAFQNLKGADSAKVLGDEMPSFEEAAIRYTAAQAIDHHSPKGNAELAKGLEAIVEKRKSSPDKAKVSADKPVRDVVYRLNARAQA